MMSFLEIAVRNARLTITALVFFLVAGTVAYLNIPKEAEPDVQIPVIYVRLALQGISPEDAERLLVRPVETQVKNIKGIDKITSNSYQGGGNVIIEFEPSADLSSALEDVRSKVSNAKREFPAGTDEPSVNEVNISEFPILVVTLSGNAPERVLTRTAKELRDRFEEVSGVLEAKLQGSRDEMVEVNIDPVKLSSYNLRLDNLIGGVNANNQLVAAGTLQGQEGKYAVKVPALIETVEDVANLPIAASGNAVVRARDLATIRSTFEDATSIARLNGKPAIAIEVSKRTGANLIETVDGVKAAAEEFKSLLPGRRPGHLQPGQVQGHPHDARGPAELGADRGDPGLHRHPVFPRYPLLGADRPGDSDLVPDRHPGAFGRRLHGQHRRAVQPDPRGRHARRRRDHRDRICRTAHDGGHGLRPGFRGSGAAHVRPGRRGDGDPHRGLFAAAVLAGHRRRVHGLSPDHADRDAFGLDSLRAVLRADARLDLRQGACRAAQAGRPLHDGRQEGGAASDHHAFDGRGADGGDRRRLRQVQQGHGVLPERRTGLRPGLCACARQPVARRAGRSGAHGRKPHAQMAGHRDRLYPRRRLERRRRLRRQRRRGRDRHDPVRVRRLARAQAGAATS